MTPADLALLASLTKAPVKKDGSGALVTLSAAPTRTTIRVFRLVDIFWANLDCGSLRLFSGHAPSLPEVWGQATQALHLLAEALPAADRAVTTGAP